MNELKVFNYEENEVRTVMVDGETWWVLKDVCSVLRLFNSRMVASRLDEDELMSVKLTSGGQMREMTAINESGLYSVILRSDKPNAKAFKKWVTSEVLPTIRKTGGYVSDDELFIKTYLPWADDAVKSLFRTHLEIIRQATRKIEEMKPKADYYDRLVEKGHLTSIRNTAKQLGIGEREFTQWLIDKKYVSRNAKDNIEPGWKAMRDRLFEFKDWGTDYASGIHPYVTVHGKKTFLMRLIEEGKVMPVITKKKPPVKKTLKPAIKKAP